MWLRLGDIPKIINKMQGLSEQQSERRAQEVVDRLFGKKSADSTAKSPKNEKRRFKTTWDGN
jgi:hypothetical protein